MISFHIFFIGQFLADQELGKYIFHPSSRGLYYLTISLKICNGVYVHKDIVEGGKGSDFKKLAELGETLKIGEETFEDINQVSILNSDFRCISEASIPPYPIYVLFVPCVQTYQFITHLKFLSFFY